MASKTVDEEKRRLIFQGNIEVLLQARSLLNELSDAQYSKIPSQYAESSIGQHIRHILDIYQAISPSLSGGSRQHIDYDVRRRGAKIEVDRLTAIDELDQFIERIKALDPELESPELLVSTEVLLSSQEQVNVLSNLDRELIFASSHTVHHLALIGVIAKLLGMFVPDSFGVAPSTASFLRDQSQKSTL